MIVLVMDMLKLALSFYGLKEITGKADNPIILNWFKEIGHGWVANDETAWCSCFMNYCALKCGLEMSGLLTARSWENVGVKVENPKLGDIVIFWREKPGSWKGHVGWYISEDDTFVYTLGGNQNNSVCIKPYPKYRLLGYRRLREKI